MLEPDSKIKAVLERIKHLEQDIVRANEFLADGSHAHWQKFEPLFVKKVRNGKELPPHRDWVKNVFLPGRERSLTRARKVLEKLESPVAKRNRQPEKNSPPE
jgi:hypothetical protein